MSAARPWLPTARRWATLAVSEALVAADQAHPASVAPKQAQLALAVAGAALFAPPDWSPGEHPQQRLAETLRDPSSRLRRLAKRLAQAFEPADPSRGHALCRLPRVPLGDAPVHPLPSWCAWLAAAGVLQIDSVSVAPEPGEHWHRDVQVCSATLVGADARWPIRVGARALALPRDERLFVAHFPDLLRADWRGPVGLRAAAHRGGVRVEPVWRPDLPPRPRRWASCAAWIVARASSGANARPAAGAGPPPYLRGVGERWPSGWPLWWRLWYRRAPDSEEQALSLLHLPTLWSEAHPPAVPPAARVTARARSTAFAAQGPAVRCGVVFDVGTSTTCVKEQDRFDGQHPGSIGQPMLSRPRSGFRLLAGDPLHAWRYGCGEHLQTLNGFLPTQLCFASPNAEEAVLEGRVAAADALICAWLPQRPPPGLEVEPAGSHGEGLAGGADDGSEAGLPNAWPPPGGERRPPTLKRFKWPERLADQLSDLDLDVDVHTAAERLLHCYGRVLGLTTAATHARPAAATGGSPRTSPRLAELDLRVLYPELEWRTATAGEPGVSYEDVLRRVALESLVPALRAAWRVVSEPMLVSETATVRALLAQPASPAPGSRRLPGGARPWAPVVVYADLGGLTLHVVVELLPLPGLPAPRVRGLAMAYSLGGEGLLDAWAYACAVLQGDGHQRRLVRAEALRAHIDEGGRLGSRPDSAAHAEALRSTLRRRAVALIARQVRAACRLAAPHTAAPGRYGLADLQVHALGQGWLLGGLDEPDGAAREQRVADRFLPSALKAELERSASLELGRRTGARQQEERAIDVRLISKERVCEGAFLLPRPPDNADSASPTAPLRPAAMSHPAFAGVGLRWGAGRRSSHLAWFARFRVAGAGPPAPERLDPWFDDFTGGSGCPGVDRPSPPRSASAWLSEAPSREALVQGLALSYEVARSPLRHWVERCGVSRMALDLLEELEQSSGPAL